MAAEVTLEHMAPRHAESVQRLASHPEIVANTTLPEPYPENGAEQWIEHLLPRRKAGKEFAFAVMNAEGELVGVTGLDNMSDDVAELGYWVGKPYWNQGYATTAVRKTIGFAFEELGLRRIFARPLHDNAPSRRILEKLGFEEGPMETHEHPKWGEEDNVVRYELNLSRWGGRLFITTECHR